MDQGVVPELCTALGNPSYLNFVVSSLLAVGIVYSYIPQQLRIYWRRNSKGISPWFLLLGQMSGICTLANVLLLSTGVMSCCRFLSGGKCFAASLGVIQMALQFVMFSVTFILYLSYFPRDHVQEYRLAVLVAIFSVAHLIVTSLVAVIAYAADEGVQAYAGFLGIQATLLSALQYFPQLYMTFRLGHAESLSIHTLCMQAPGGFIWALSLAAREGTSWSSWLPYMFSAFLQTILLFMCVYFEYYLKKEVRYISVGQIVAEEEEDDLVTVLEDEENHHFE
ncbi:hypothetical protein V1514DRAFT_274875 [Lipomyces japonicus]|uniref:uncharacterized protein n=1 Tax=Lipomyces japonicus TaxID=56871 RepID=UPI0034CE248D